MNKLSEKKNIYIIVGSLEHEKSSIDIMLGRRTKNRYKRKSPKRLPFVHIPCRVGSQNTCINASMGLAE